MKRLALFLAAVICLTAMSAGASAATCTWNGLIDNNWSNVLNWTGCPLGPQTTDSVLLDNSMKAGSYTVTLPTGATTTTIVNLTITPGAGNTITLVLPSGNTANPGFRTGDVIAGTDDIILNSGAVLMNSSGAGAGNGVEANSTTNGTVRINNGARYVHNTIRSTTGVVPLLSTVAGTETGIFEYDPPGTGAVAISASGRNYGSLTLTRTAGAATYTSTGGSAVTIRGEFLINSGITYSSTMTGGMNVAGNLTNNGTALTIPAAQTVVLNGTSAQTISGNGPINFSGLTVNNASGVTLNNGTPAIDATVSGLLTLTTDLTVAPGAILQQGGTSAGTADVVGTVRRTDLNTIPKSFGNPNVQVGVDAGATVSQLDVMLVKTAPGSFSNAVTRIYTLSPGAGSFTAATVRLHYLDSELNGNTGSSLHLYRAVGSPTATWQDQGAPFDVLTTSDPNNWIENNNVTAFSSWTLANSGQSPTAVQLTKFNAASYTDGVQLSWESGYEVNNLGYHVYREENSKRVPVTTAVVAGSALSVGQGNQLTAGYSYSWFDPKGTTTTPYYLEAIDLDGSTQLVGPIYPLASRTNSPKRQRAMLLNEIAGVSSGGREAETSGPASGTDMSFSRSMTTTPDSLSVQQTIAAGRAVKIGVNRSGWQRVTQSELVAAGLDPTSNSRMLQLYVDGQEVPIRLSGDGSRFEAGDTLEFYGVALDTSTTDKRVYWLINGNSAGKRITAKRVKVKPGDRNWVNSPATGSFTYSTGRAEKLVYFSSLLNGEQENIFGRAILAEPVGQTLTVRNFDARSAVPPRLEVSLQGLTAQEHEVRVQFNGVDLGNVSFNAKEHPVTTFSLNSALVRDGDNTVTLVSTNGQSDISLIDSVRLNYAHRYTADDNALGFSLAGGELLRIDGFTSPDIRVVDVTNPNSPQELSTVAGPSGSGYAVRVQSIGSGQRTLLAFADDVVNRPSSITANEPSSWNADINGADLVIITHRNFRAAIEPLANLRRNEGLSVAVVDVEDVYDEFSYGAHTPLAIKNFLMAASANWSHKAGYVLLVGDSSWDPRNYLAEGDNDYLPTKLIDTAYMETSSDDWLVDFSGTGQPQMAVGRLPGRSATEISLMVSKILGYQQELETNAPPRGAVLVADTGFESQSNQTRNLLPSDLAVESINRAEVGNDDVMRGDVLEALNQGPMIVNYYGHGSVGVWTGAGILTGDLASSLMNTNRPSLFVLMTCLNGYAHDAFVDSLGESALKSQNGAAAVWASSGYTEPQPQFEMNTEFYRILFGSSSVRLGDVARSAKLTVRDTDVRRTWTLLGDPTMRLK